MLAEYEKIDLEMKVKISFLIDFCKMLLVTYNVAKSKEYSS